VLSAGPSAVSLLERDALAGSTVAVLETVIARGSQSR
jgi:hypothetical protein